MNILSFPQIDQHLVAVQAPATQAALVRVVQQTCQDSRNPGLPLQNTLPLLNALNACLPRADRFDPRQGSCAVELLVTLLEELPLIPGQLVTHLERGECGTCRAHWDQVGAFINSSLLYLHTPCRNLTLTSATCGASRCQCREWWWPGVGGRCLLTCLAWWSITGRTPSMVKFSARLPPVVTFSR